MTDVMANPFMPSAPMGGGDLWLDKPKHTGKTKLVFLFFLVLTAVTLITAFVFIASAFATGPSGCGGG